MFSSDAAAKPQRKKMVVLTLHYCHYLLYFLCVSLRRSSLTLFYLLYFCVFLCGEAAEKKMVPGSVHLHYLLYFCVFLCGEAAEKKMVVFTYTTYFAAQPQRKI